jgi:hypothetical protein
MHESSQILRSRCWECPADVSENASRRAWRQGSGASLETYARECITSRILENLEAANRRARAVREHAEANGAQRLPPGDASDKRMRVKAWVQAVYGPSR